MSKTQIYLDDLNRVLGFIERADNKAEILLSIAGAMAGLTSIAQGIVKSDMTIVMILIILSILGYLASIIYSLVVIFPRLVPKDHKGSRIYFDTAAKLEAQEKGCVFKFYKEIDEKEYDNELIKQIIENNRVAESKYQKLKWSVFYLAIAVSMTCASIISINVG